MDRTSKAPVRRTRSTTKRKKRKNKYNEKKMKVVVVVMKGREKDEGCLLVEVFV